MSQTFSTYEQQLNKLKFEKHLSIPDIDNAKNTLEQLSYYSLFGGYKGPFIHTASGQYKHGVTFDEIVAFYYFDEELRILFLKYILLIKHILKECPHISQEQLLSAMGFPKNWANITRYKK